MGKVSIWEGLRDRIRKAANRFVSMSSRPSPPSTKQNLDRWHSFEEILQRLHQEGIYLHPNQLAEFFVAHGLPVDLNYVPHHLKSKAMRINANYSGDMARVEDIQEPSWYAASLLK
jgi:hypothetical protein